MRKIPIGTLKMSDGGSGGITHGGGTADMSEGWGGTVIKGNSECWIRPHGNSITGGGQEV